MSNTVTKGEERREVHSLLNPDIPFHHQIYWHLRSEIQDGIWVGRDDFPGEVEAAARYKVSVITARTALERLASEGLLNRGRGRRPQPITPQNAAELESPQSVEFPVGPSPFKYSLLFARTEVAPTAACVAFGLPIGSKLWMCSRLRTFKRRKHSVTLNAQVPDIGKAHSLADLQKLPMAQIIREAGLEPAVMQRQVSVRFPSPAVAEALGVTIYDALLTYTFLITNAESRAIEWVRIQLHPDEHARWETLDVATDSAKITAAV